MIDITRNQSYIQQYSCDHVFSHATQDGVHIFKCEACNVEHRFTGDRNAETTEA